MRTEDSDTLSETIRTLRTKGYTEDFNLQCDRLECKVGGYTLSPHEFQVDDVFRFEGASDPGDESILYAISLPSRGVKGVLVNAYGIYSDGTTNELLEKLVIKH